MAPLYDDWAFSKRKSKIMGYIILAYERAKSVPTVGAFNIYPLRKLVCREMGWSTAVIFKTLFSIGILC